MPGRFIVTDLFGIPGTATKYHSVIDDMSVKVICSCVVHSGDLKDAKQRAEVIAKLLNENVPLEGSVEECLLS